MKTLKKTISMLMVAATILTAGVFTSCDDEGDYNTSQFKGGVSLTAAQMQVTRGSYMQFKGNGLEKITSIIFPVEIAANPEVVDKYTIRCIVPEEATVGNVRLIYAGGEIVTEEVLGFNEPVEITEFTKSGRAGDLITIKGRYLENFTHARFATGEAVALKSVSRTEAQVVVPVDASTGEVVLLYYTEVNGEKIASEHPVGDVTLAQPSVEAVATVVDIYPGDVVTIKGKDLDLIDYLTLPGDIKIKDFKGDATAINFNAPAEMRAGTVVATSFAGITTDLVSVAPKAATITALVNANVAELADTVKNGKDLIIKGQDLNLISRIEFVGAEAVTVFTVNEAGTEIKLAMPAMAKTGDVKVIAKSEAVATTKVVTLKPKCTGVGPWPQIAGKSATFYGTDMDLIKTITLPSGEVLSELTDRSETAVTVLIPYTASGAQFSKVEMNNGEVIDEYQWVDVTAVDYCYPVEVAKSYQAGSTGAIKVANIDKLTGVKIGGQDVTFITYDSETLYLPMTFSNVGTKKCELISGEQSFTFDLNIVAGEVEEVIYETPIELVSWENHEMKDIVVPEMPDGAKIRIRYTKTSDDAALQVFNGHWGMIWAATEGNDNQTLLQSSDYVEFDPAVIFEFTDWGYPVIFQGHGLVISSITWVKDFSSGPKSCVVKDGTHGDAEYWSFPVALNWSAGSRFVLFKTSPIDLSEYMSEGHSLVFYASGTGQIQINTANWSSIETVAEWSDAGEHEFEVPITQAYIDAFNNGDGWSDCWLIIQGDGMTITDVAIK